MTEASTSTPVTPSNTNHNLTQFWRGHVERWTQSGLSKAAYSKQAQVNYHQMIYWSNKLNPVPRDATDKQSKNVGGFVAVSLAPPAASTGLRLHLPNGMEISGVQEGQLSRLINLVSQ